MEALAALNRSKSILKHIEALANIAERCVPIGNHRDGDKHGAFERVDIAGWTVYNKTVLSHGQLNGNHLVKLDAVLGGEVAALRHAQGGFCLSCDIYNCIVREMRFDVLLQKLFGAENPMSTAMHDTAAEKAEQARNSLLTRKLQSDAAAGAANTAENQLRFGARSVSWNTSTLRPLVGKILGEFRDNTRGRADTAEGDWSSELYRSLGFARPNDRGVGLTHLDLRSLEELIKCIHHAVMRYSRYADGRPKSSETERVQGCLVLAEWPGERIRRRITFQAALAGHDDTRYQQSTGGWLDGTFQPIRPLPLLVQAAAAHQAHSLGSEARIGWRAARIYGYGTPADFALERGRL